MKVVLADGQPLEEHRDFSYRFEITARESGYELVRTTLKQETWRQGEKQEDPLAALNLDFPVTLSLDSEGHVEAVEGYEGYLEEAQRRLAPEVYKAKIASGSWIETMKQGDRDAWEERRGYLTGKSLAPGESHSLQVVISGTLYSTECKFIETASKQDRNLAHVRCYMASSGGFFHSNFGFPYQGSTGVDDSAGPDIALVRDRWIDPTTGLIYEEELTVEHRVQTPTGIIENQQHREYSFKY